MKTQTKPIHIMGLGTPSVKAGEWMLFGGYKGWLVGDTKCLRPAMKVTTRGWSGLDVVWWRSGGPRRSRDLGSCHANQIADCDSPSKHNDGADRCRSCIKFDLGADCNKSILLISNIYKQASNHTPHIQNK